MKETMRHKYFDICFLRQINKFVGSKTEQSPQFPPHVLT